MKIEDAYKDLFKLGYETLDNWDEEGAPKPYSSAIKNALQILVWCDICEITIEEVGLDVLGGIAIDANIDDCNIWFGVLNSGRPIIIVRSSKDNNIILGWAYSKLEDILPKLGKSHKSSISDSEILKICFSNYQYNWKDNNPVRNYYLNLSKIIYATIHDINSAPSRKYMKAIGLLPYKFGNGENYSPTLNRTSSTFRNLESIIISYAKNITQEVL